MKKGKRALFECCGQHIELIPSNGKLLSNLTCVMYDYCEYRWKCLKLSEAYRKCEEVENGAEVKR
ncbi:hypothetical protein LCGC14_0514280 [marine sediment metagenome]|uniref:Uncharacterized protein n=1 Tax=marine sediment metagenome TaxID=412755 RepID=A0A0F9S4Z6_9ZZZZ